MLTKKGLLASLRRQMMKVPKGIRALYPLVPPNLPTRVFKGRLAGKPREMDLVRGRLDYHWLPNPQLRFSGSARKEIDFDTDPVQIQAPHNGAWINAFITRSTFGTKKPHVEGVFTDCVRLGPDRAVRSVLFHVPNFHSYVGDSIRFDLTLYKGRLALGAGEWIATIDQSPSHEAVRKALKVHGGFGIGHAGLITRVDGRRFKIAQISDFWSMLFFFLTFARGSWCGPIIPVGMGSRRPVWTEWCSWRIESWKEVRSWFPLVAGQIQQAFGGFHLLWSDPRWNDPLRDLVNWYVEANLNAGAVEGSLVLAHAGLELLSWMRLIVNGLGQAYTPKVFGELSADKRIRLVLADLRIPLDVPKSLSDAAALAATENLSDGPELINRLRNAIVHPTPAKRAFLAGVRGPCRNQVVQLALHYLELGILAICGYQGEYMSRLIPGAWVGGTSKVPWA